MTKNKAIILDLDGVVVNSPKQKLPSKELIEIVNKLQKTHHISAATGRVWTFAKDILKKLKLDDPCIISAGTQICNPLTGEIIWQKTIKKETIEKVIEILKQYPNYKLIYNDTSEDDYFYGGVYPKDFHEEKPVFVLNFIFVPNALAKEISEKLNHIENIVCILATAQKSGCNDLHITSKEATKESAVEELFKIINVKKENSIGVGDAINDIHLFHAVGKKIAMGNAVDELKEYADEVIGDIKDDGLVEYLASHT